VAEQPYKVRQKLAGKVVVLEVTGRLEAVPDGRDGLLALVEQRLQEGRKNFVVNLSRVRMVTSLGVGGLLNLLRVVGGNDGALKLLSPSFTVRQILRVSQLETLFEIFEDEAVAVSSFDQIKDEKKKEGPTKHAKRREKILV
jgi:anti-sigma B factor antagonist